MTSKTSNKQDREQEAHDDLRQRTDRDDRIRKASIGGATPAAIAEAEGISVATVRRSLKRSTNASLDAAEAKGAEAKADRLADLAKSSKAKKEEAKAAAVVLDHEDPVEPVKAEPKPKRSNGERSAVPLADVLSFNPKWTDEDRAVIEREVKRIGGTTFWRPPSGSYLRVEDGEGKLVLAIEKARLRFPKGVEAPKGATSKTKEPFADLALSTSRG